MESRSKYRQRMLTVLASAAALIGVFALQFGAAPASASTSPYCGGPLAASTGCEGAARYEYQTYGYGDVGGVCVWANAQATMACITGTSGVYSGNLGANYWGQPGIYNISQTQTVHGIALTH